MQLRKQRQADRRSVELTQAVAASQPGGDVARRLTQLQFQSSLSGDITPQSRIPPPPACGFEPLPRQSASMPLASVSGFGGAHPDEDLPPHPHPHPHPPRACSPSLHEHGYGYSERSERGGGGGGGSDDDTVRESLHATAAHALPLSGTSGRRAVPSFDVPSSSSVPSSLPSRAPSVPSGTVSTMLETGVYEADFEDYAPTERLSPDRLGLREDTRNGGGSAVDAQRARLRDLGSARSRVVDLARRELAAPQRPSGGDDDGGNHPAPVVPREAPLQALKQRCADALGGDFGAVYSYLKRARQQNEADGAVRRNLLSIVGSSRLNDCMWVDQLIFKEELASTPASPRR